MTPVSLFNESRTITVSTYCGCIAVSFTLFAVHFIYRYWAVCQPKKLKFFKGSNFGLWLLGVFCVAVSWGAFSFFCFPGSLRAQKSFQLVQGA
ncbi:Protein CBG06659 [Caenorhabditis briggsae]|uniref:Protein CBG06659 n=1 Tax=Caenorhabditis briggsae TaxID=6238 RepID=A8X2S7_CAEBR|nr:Protein CBG06659 [Caenorhabditis briggsae]CAP26937.2 Protein CBG06659 [Caenorhabditis briggsae]